MDNVATRLFEAWRRMPDSAAVGTVLDGLAEPGPAALRSRYLVLREASKIAGQRFRYDEAQSVWNRQIGLEGDGDAALRRGDWDAARTAFSALRETWEEGRHPLAGVHAQLGLGEVERNLDRYGQALSYYEDALARAHPHYPLGEMRVRVSLGYLILLGRSSLDTEEQFVEAARIARDLADGAALELASDLLARADQAGPVGKNWRRPDDDEERRAELRRRLGTLAVRGAMPDIASRELDDLVATLYRPCTRARAAELVAGMATDQLTAAVVRLPDDDRLGWAVWLPDGGVSIGFITLPADAVALLDRLARQGLSAQDGLLSLAPLAELLPEPLAAPLAARGLPRTTLIPIGELWSVPWNAVPLGNEAGKASVLGAATALTIVPSLSVFAGIRAVERPLVSTPVPVAAWRSPQINGHQLLGLHSDGWRIIPITDAAQAVAALTGAAEAFAVVAGHGIPVQGIGHYLELDATTPLTPAALLRGQAPDRAVLIACWGAGYPQVRAADPLSLATVALARGARQVAATVGELGDGGPANRFIDAFLYQVPAAGLPEALRRATEAYLSTPQFRDSSILNWAPLTVVGVHLNATEPVVTSELIEESA